MGKEMPLDAFTIKADNAQIVYTKQLFFLGNIHLKPWARNSGETTFKTTVLTALDLHFLALHPAEWFTETRV